MVAEGVGPAKEQTATGGGSGSAPQKEAQNEDETHCNEDVEEVVAKATQENKVRLLYICVVLSACKCLGGGSVWLQTL